MFIHNSGGWKAVQLFPFAYAYGVDLDLEEEEEEEENQPFGVEFLLPLCSLIGSVGGVFDMFGREEYVPFFFCSPVVGMLINWGISAMSE